MHLAVLSGTHGFEGLSVVHAGSEWLPLVQSGFYCVVCLVISSLSVALNSLSLVLAVLTASPTLPQTISLVHTVSE